MDSNFPLVCICVPTYNATATVRETLESILAQTYPNLVVHVSDNASTDETLQVIEAIADSRVHIHRNEVNVGGEGNFTRCIQLAEGKYTAIFHADDLYESDMVSRQVAFLESNADICAVFTAATTIDESGVSHGEIGNPPSCAHGVEARYNFKNLLQTILLHHNFLICPSAMVRTEVYKNEIKEWGGSLFKSASDVDTWLRLANFYQIAVLNEPLMRYRISSAQFSNRIRSRIEQADFFLVMDHYLTKPDVVSFLSKQDFQHYAWLRRHECVARAINLLGLDRVGEAKDLLKGLICWDSIHAAMVTRRGLVTLVGGALLKFLILFGISKESMVFVRKLKNIYGR